MKELYQVYFERLARNPCDYISNQEQLPLIRSKVRSDEAHPVLLENTYYSAAFGKQVLFKVWDEVHSQRSFLEALVEANAEDRILQWHTPVWRAVSRLIVRAGNLELLKWARGKGLPWTERVCIESAAAGHLELLKYARANGCPWDKGTINCAASGGYLEVVEWANLNGCTWYETTCAAAASGGHLGVLKSAHEGGCPWDIHTCRIAAQEGNLEVLKYAHEHGCPWDAQVCAMAAQYGHVETLTYLYKNGCPGAEEYLAETILHSTGA